MVEVVNEAFRAGFKHLFIGQPARSVCSFARDELVDEMYEKSEVDVPDTPTCWLCLALEDWAKKQGLPLDSSSFTGKSGV